MIGLRLLIHNVTKIKYDKINTHRAKDAYFVKHSYILLFEYIRPYISYTYKTDCIPENTLLYQI